MKNKIIIFFFIIFIFSCNNILKNKPNHKFHITGTTNNITDNTKVFLKIQENKTIITLDSTLVKNGIFQFEDKIIKPSVFGIYIDSIKSNLGFFIKNDSITIEINKDNLSDSKITGSKLNNQYLNYVKSINQIVSETNLLYPIFQKARAENNVQKLNEINKKMQAINNKKNLFALNYAKEHADSYIAAFALHSVINDNAISKDTILTIYNRFSDEVKEGDFAIEILIYLENEGLFVPIKN